MKILQLRFKNLNSLAGEWTIDFTAPEYVTDGIFAISGPTGAGKSTIMDAICLALYGRTPRLKGFSKSSNEIMSRHTGECFSEVVFETRKGQFRCTWSQHRGRRKANEELQNPNHEIADYKTGQIIESKLRSVAIAIEERTGMDFDRFTQSMLLAQGGFAAFLQADPDDRSDILEQMTGSQIYSEISKLVFDRKRVEKNKLEVLQGETAGIILLNTSQEQLIQQELEDTKNAEKELAVKKSAIDSAILWLHGIGALKDELAKIELETEAQMLALEDFKTDRLLLQKALKAAELDGEYASLLAKRDLQSTEQGILNSSQLKVPELQAGVDLSIKNFTMVSNALIRKKEELDNELKIIQSVRALDVRMMEKQEVLNRSLSGHRAILATKLGQIKEKKSLQSQVLDTKGKLTEIEIYFTTNKNDGALITELTGIKIQLINLKVAKEKYLTLKKLLAESERLLKTAEQAHQVQEEHCQKLVKDQSAVHDKLTQSRQTMNQLLDGKKLTAYRIELAHLNKELAYQRKIADLEAERNLLVDNQPCPLCGSLHHPFAAGNMPVPSETEKAITDLNKFIEKAEQLEAEQTTLNTGLQEVATRRMSAEMELLNKRNNKVTYELALTNSLSDHNHAFENYTGLLNALAALLHQFGVTNLLNGDPDTISNALDKRLNDWHDHQQKRTILEGQINSLGSGIENFNVLIRSTGESMKEKLAEVTAFRLDLEQLKVERVGVYGLKNPDLEQNRLAGAFAAAERSEREADAAKNKRSQQLSELTNRIKELTTSTTNRQTELNSTETIFRESLQASGFDDEAIFNGCRLSRDRREALTKRANLLDSQQADIGTRKKDREDRLKLEVEKNLTKEAIDDLVKQQEAIAESVSSMMKDIGARMQQLAYNAKARERFGQITLLIEAQKVECAKWDSLSNLIGSADGKKYRNFAQGLTFEIMVAHANIQLMKLTDRYLLIRDKDLPLDLNVVDNYQAGEIRSTKNLSGGESFIVSLALALGLSKMASKKVRVDSLFLDEGFGTLDEDTLETALETLASLRQDGKLIGVISHVAALKERITTRILVEKVSGGKSIISGPGCYQNN